MERGAATVFVVGMSIVLLVCAGLVVDGGMGIAARMRVADDAEQASRVAADSINLELLRETGEIAINPALARQRAESYLMDRGYSPGRFEVLPASDQSVRVEVRGTSETYLLKLIGINSYEVAARATSSPQTGPEGES
ncbi:hypothetical protein D9V41_03645 [Aeromicrobium phragmitis]|uniref:Uncharacterized protein n=2 Tax=Aeromicrobium phragmitis TaxID=2478914 RepID=A0A3L8PN77_9ACTN|nr:hypothetical protein D9V41_03645 [Aeromicrobium phragmitis]